MDAIVRGLVVYLFLLILFRIAGRRTLGSITNFDFVLLLIISEATQNAMIGNDYSVTNGFLVILTLVGLDIVLSYMKQRFPAMERYLDGLPLILVDQGRPLKDLMYRVRVDEQDILAAAREKHGLERMDQIKYAILETNGRISIVPKPG
ncbi:MAG: YetF domain-containing protein [Nitrospira sp.]